MASRAFGWIQDGGKIENLRRTVEIFDHRSPTYQELIKTQIPRLVEERDGRDRLLTELHRIPLKLKYEDLVGTCFQTSFGNPAAMALYKQLLRDRKREFILWIGLQTSFLKMGTCPRVHSVR